MSFCGTPRLEKRMKLRGFAMHCHAIISRLMHQKIAGGIDKTEAGEQYRLFQLTNDDREDLSKFAKNIRWFKEDHKEHGEEYWKAYRELEYINYELYVLFDHVTKEEVFAAADALDKASREEPLTEDENKATTDLLRKLGHSADGMIDDGGCF